VFVQDFRVRDIVIKGLAWEAGKRYLMALRRVGFTTRKGRLWSITSAGQGYYSTFVREVIRCNEDPFFWR
jgi:hypothetical protein